MSTANFDWGLVGIMAEVDDVVLHQPNQPWPNSAFVLGGGMFASDANLFAVFNTREHIIEELTRLLQQIQSLRVQSRLLLEQPVPVGFLDVVAAQLMPQWTARDMPSPIRQLVETVSYQAASIGILNLPFPTREAIYRLVLDTKYTMKQSIHPDWVTAEVIDDTASSDIQTAWIWSRCPRVTKYNIHPAILRVSRQIYHETVMVLGRQNLWVVVSTSDTRIAQGLTEMGAALPIPPNWRGLGLPGYSPYVYHVPIEMHVEENPNVALAEQQFFVMALDCVWDLVALMISYSSTPWSLTVRLNETTFFSHQQKLDCIARIVYMLEPLRLLGEDDYSRTVTFWFQNRIAGDRMIRLNRLQNRFSAIELIGMLREYLDPFNANLWQINWAKEDLKMAEWGFFFIHAMNKYGANEQYGRMWRDTLCIGHARLMIIRLAQGKLILAKHHAQRADEVAELHQVTLWWCKPLISRITGWDDEIPNRDTIDEALRAIWCLCWNERKSWFHLLWQHYKGAEHEAHGTIVYAVHLLEGIRLILANTNEANDLKKQAKVFNNLMCIQGTGLNDGCTPEQRDYHNLTTRSVINDSRLPDSVQQQSIEEGVMLWRLIE
ncbi:hypothetical protein TRV_02724 [Trichophyton verrucosum HKI 0517]|uniref:Uncharacterized protein n=1 Tax=Trichophyton verrucosum (strain HKI 0517) TaxID=663202 RepID=D4D6J8_TRIVH|nr:uncharacterized protein TRV_02724 [Trichophyton verrucosum HKI 0517]EFE42527.1 hypothetical protein TRV_02724 [Trichophyton verrucosum HKI 0517]